MSKDTPSAVFVNAIDSLQMGVSHFLHNDAPNRDKWSILTLFHSIELFLKERLRREHPLLMYRNIDRRIDDGAPTVGSAEILIRFQNLAIDIADAEIALLRDLQKRRNQIEHFRYVPAESHRLVVAKALKFIYYFLSTHLDSSLQDSLEDDDFRAAVALILEYDERLAEASRLIAAQRATLGSDDVASHPVVKCPSCGNDALLIEADRGDFCYFCHREQSVERCRCGKYQAALSWGMCSDCFGEGGNWV